jgi:hypothetical protein
MVLGVTQKAHRNLRRSNRTVFDAEVDSGARQDAPALAALWSFSELECPAGADFRREVGIDFLGKGNAGHA